MKLSILAITILLVCSASLNADHHTIDNEYYAGLTLYNYDTLLMTGGGLHDLDIYDRSQATIQGTYPLAEGSGGIWLLRQFGHSYLEFSGGGIHELVLTSSSQARLSEGSIDEIRSYQTAWKWDGDPLEWVPDPHIEIVCHDDWFHDTGTNILTGTWFDDTTFDIQLVDVTGYDPVIDNIFFTPEPATLLLITVGGLLLRRRRYHL